jgi:hypothetical protein
MMRNAWELVAVLGAIAALAACKDASLPSTTNVAEPALLVGAWRSQIRANSGTLSEMKDLEFMYVFNAGGTMTESSNYDGVPPVPPAYGIWRNTGPREFEARYAFYTTQPPRALDEITKGGGWSSNGHGVLAEKITIADDGKSYESTIVYTFFDSDGKPTDGGGEASGAGVRMGF